MIDWRDVDSPESLNEFSRDFSALCWEDKQPILAEMLEMFEEQKKKNTPYGFLKLLEEARQIPLPIPKE